MARRKELTPGERIYCRVLDAALWSMIAGFVLFMFWLSLAYAK